MGLLRNDKRPTCDETWEADGHEAVCDRPSVVTVDGVSYCQKHAKYAPITDR